jgi:DNA-binding Lrp family transcriptional regulator
MTMAFIMLNAEVGSEDELAKDLKKLANVKEVYPVYGVYDIVVKVEADTMEQLREVVSRIRKLNKVKSSLTMTVMDGSKT